MNPIRKFRANLFIVAFFALGAHGLQAEGGSLAGDGTTAPRVASAKPWDWERECSWWLSDDDGKSLRASIEQGDEGLVVSLADPVFLEWPEEDRPQVEVVFDGDARRRVSVEGWSTHIGTETAIFGFELDAEGLRMLSDATSINVHRDGRSFFELPLAATPNEADLVACIRPPPGDRSDQE